MKKIMKNANLEIERYHGEEKRCCITKGNARGQSQRVAQNKGPGKRRQYLSNKNKKWKQRGKYFAFSLILRPGALSTTSIISKTGQLIFGSIMKLETGNISKLKLNFLWKSDAQRSFQWNAKHGRQRPSESPSHGLWTVRQFLYFPGVSDRLFVGCQWADPSLGQTARPRVCQRPGKDYETPGSAASHPIFTRGVAQPTPGHLMTANQ